MICHFKNIKYEFPVAFKKNVLQLSMVIFFAFIESAIGVMSFTVMKIT